MKLADFAFFSTHADHKSINLAARPVEEAIRYEMARRDPIHAPFSKLLVRLLEPSARPIRPHQLLSIMEVAMRLDPADIPEDPTASDRFFLDLASEALIKLRDGTGWRSDTLDDVIETLRSSDVRTIEFDWLAKKEPKTGNTYTPLYLPESDGTWEVAVRVTAPDGSELTRARVASSELGPFVEREFPIHSAIIKDGRYVLRDRERNPLASVLLA